jgi:hypothetical protein
MITQEQLQYVRRESRKATFTLIAIILIFIVAATMSVLGWIWLIRLFEFAKMIG